LNDPKFIDLIKDKKIKSISNKILSHERITEKEALALHNKADLGLLSVLTSFVKDYKNGLNVYYIKNAHLEPTNICIYKCKFCSFSQISIDNKGWDLSEEEIISKLKKFPLDIKEVHITGAVNPSKPFIYYVDLIKTVKKILPGVSIKAFSAVELNYIFNKENISFEKGIRILKEAGLSLLPGGGAEIFNQDIRKKICPEKVDSKNWLKIHEIAHKNNISSGATMLYGHIENIEHRIEHLKLIRELQDKTSGFSSFIPLKFKNKNNLMSNISEVSIIEDLRTFAVSRIFLDNIPHIKAYWPMLGKETTQISLSFGVDDIDGTINNSTKIYTTAGSGESSPTMNVDEINNLITTAGFIPVERDSYYNKIN